MKVLNQTKKKNLKRKISYIYIALTVIFLLPVSCNRVPEEVLSQSQMVVFLSDLHKLDGTLSAKGLTTIDDRENIYFYNALLAKHNITKEKFDTSLVWYTRNPKKFNKIYKEVLLVLNKEDSIVRNLKGLYDDSIANAVKHFDIWNKNRLFVITKDSSFKQIDFDVAGYEFFTGDFYELKFLHRSHSSDSAAVESTVMRIKYENDFTDSISAQMPADSLLRRYTLRFKARHQGRVERITGVISRVNMPEKRIRTVVDSISLNYKYSPQVHNAMRLKLQNDTDEADTNKLKRKLPHIPQKNKIQKEQ